MRGPANQALDAPLQLTIAGIRKFLRDRNSVYVGRVELDRCIDTGASGPLGKRVQQPGCSAGPLLVYYLVEGFKPFVYFLKIRLDLRRRVSIHCAGGHRNSMR